MERFLLWLLNFGETNRYVGPAQAALIRLSRQSQVQAGLKISFFTVPVEQVYRDIPQNGAVV